MNQLKVINQNGQLLVDSREVAVMIEKEHKNLLADIRSYISSLLNFVDEKGKLMVQPSEFFIPNTYRNSQNKEQPCFLITKKGCDMVANKMIGDKGIRFTATYVTKFEEMENHIKSNQLDTSKLSPELQLMNQMFQAMAKNELETKEVKQLALETKKEVNNISNIVSLNNVGWREKVSVILKKIAKNWSGIEPYRSVINLSYERFEKRAGCKLDIRLNNRKERAIAQGMSKSYVQKINKLDVIAEEKRLVEIYIQVIKEMAIEFRVNINDFKFEEGA